MKQTDATKQKLKSQPFFNFIVIESLRSQLEETVKLATSIRKREKTTQQEVSEIIKYSLTKVKEIEKGTCKDINAIINYIKFFLSETKIII